MDEYQKDGLKVSCYTELGLSTYSHLFCILKESFKGEKIP